MAELSSCDDIFESDKFLDTILSCEWSEPHYLSVMFKPKAPFPTEPVRLINDKVVSNSTYCSYDKWDLQVEIKEGLPYPEPHIAIVAPLIFSKRCETLSLSSKIISGDIGRDLEYKWSFGQEMSGPHAYFNSLNSDVTIPNYFPPNEYVEITLYARNFYGKVGSDTAKIFIKGIEDFDLQILGKTNILRRERNFLKAQASADCTEGDSDFIYTWGFGSDHFLHLSQLTIEANSLTADATFHYSIKATDTRTGSTKIDYIEVNVIGQDLIALIDQPSGEVSYHHGINLDGSMSFDPDSTDLDMMYQWE